MRRSCLWRAIYKEVGRKGLNEILKMELVERVSPKGITNMWLMHHEYAIQYVGKVLSAAAYSALSPRLLGNPFFVVPVFREKGLFNVMLNNQKDLTLVAPLGEFQKQGDLCQVHLTIQFFTELMNSKGLVLLRTEIKDQVLNKQDAIHITNTFLRYYTYPNCFEFVHEFNRRPNQFDYHRFLRHLKEDSKKWSTNKKLNRIDILDKKFTWSDVELDRGQKLDCTVEPTPMPPPAAPPSSSSVSG
eukprot:RCo030551